MRTCSRRGGRTAYTRDQLTAAVELARKGTKLKTVSMVTGIPLRSLRHEKNQGAARLPYCRNVFTEAQEAQLSDYIVTCSDRFHGLSTREARKLAADFAIANGIHAPPNWTSTGMAGSDWLASFQKRNRLSLRSPEATSMARASGFNKKAVKDCFANHVTLVERLGSPRPDCEFRRHRHHQWRHVHESSVTDGPETSRTDRLCRAWNDGEGCGVHS